MEESELGRHLRPRGTPGGKMEHGYGAPPGYEPLRGRIAHSLIERSIRASAEQVLLTFGANHGLDLIVRQYVEPGESVLVDSPGYYPLFGKLRLARARVVGVRRGPEGRTSTTSRPRPRRSSPSCSSPRAWPTTRPAARSRSTPSTSCCSSPSATA